MLSFAHKSSRRFSHGGRLAAGKAANPHTIVSREPIGRVIRAAGERPDLREGYAGFLGGISPRMDQSVGIGSL